MHLPGVSHTEKAADKMSFIAAWSKEFGSYSMYICKASAGKNNMDTVL